MEILLFDLSRHRGGLTSGAFKAGSDATWTWLGPIPNVHCALVLDALETGQFRVVEPRMKDIEVNGVRLRVSAERGCPR